MRGKCGTVATRWTKETRGIQWTMCQSNDGASECGIHLHPIVALCGCRCSLDMEE
jgi:hypothetical protein